eukprot:Rmarinus@m.23720
MNTFSVLIIFIFVFLVPGSRGTHECSHVELVRNGSVIVSKVTQPRPPVRRRAESDRTWVPLSIGVDYRYGEEEDDDRQCLYAGQLYRHLSLGQWIYSTCQSTDVLTDEKRSVVESMFEMIQEFLYNLYTIESFSDDPVMLEAGTCGVYDGVEIPTEYSVSGLGDYNFQTFVTAWPTTGSTVAYAAMCQVDAVTGRPIAGHINIGPNQLETAINSRMELAGVITHEIHHALGFSNSFDWENFREISDPLVYKDRDDVVQTFTLTDGDLTHDVDKIVLPRVIEVAESYFGCDDVDGVELEDDGGSGSAGSHWEKRLLDNEFMTATSSELPAYSLFTLAFMYETGWYRPDFSYATALDYGYQKGCDFINKRCTHWSDTWRGYTCDAVSGSTCETSNPYTSGDTACTYDRQAVGTCGLSCYTTDLDEWDQFFDGEPKMGGTDSLKEYCAVVTGYSNRYCYDEDNQDEYTAEYYGEMYTPGARCLESTLHYTQKNSAESYHCYNVTCAFDEIVVNVNGQEKTCTEGESVTFDGFFGSLTCPEHVLICGDEMLTKCKNDCSRRGLCIQGGCVCVDGYLGDDCSIVACPSDCSSSKSWGYCDEENDKCVCNGDRTGDDCSEPVCQNGATFDWDRYNATTGEYVCQCPDDYWGDTCEYRVPYCNGTYFLSDTAGQFSDMSYDDDGVDVVFTKFTDCVWLISPPASADAKGDVCLQFDSFDLQGSGFDHVKVYSGEMPYDAFFLINTTGSRPMFHVYHSTSSLYVEFHSSSRSSELAYGFEASYRYGSRPFCPTDDYEKNGDCSGKGVCDCYTMECICDATHEGVDCTECTTHSQCLEDLYNQALEEYGELTVDFPILAILTVFSLLGKLTCQFNRDSETIDE